MAKTLKDGDPAPDFALLDQGGETRELSELRGKWVLVYFYPRDDTPGCTVEACGVRDAWSRFAQGGIEVLGISADGVKSHKKFADKYALPFTLLADEEKAVVHAYGAWGKKKFMGREFDGILRQSFLIDPKGKIAKVYAKVRPESHAEEVLADVERLRSGANSAGSRAAPKAPTKIAAKPSAPKAPAKAKKAPTPARGTPRAARKSKPKG